MAVAFWFAVEPPCLNRPREEQDELVYPESASNIFRITDDIYSAATGLSGDVRYQASTPTIQSPQHACLLGAHYALLSAHVLHAVFVYCVCLECVQVSLV